MKHSGDEKESLTPNEQSQFSKSDSQEPIPTIKESFAKIASIYEALNKRHIQLQKPKKTIFHRFFHWVRYSHKNSRHLGAYLLFGIAAFGYYLNFKADVANTRYSQIEQEVQKKQAFQQNLTRAATMTRTVSENQMILCKQSPLTQAQMKAERNNSVIDIITLSYGIHSTFGYQVEKGLREFILEIDKINDPCQFNVDEFDSMMIKRYRDITNLINASIGHDLVKMSELVQTTHVEVPH